MNQIIDIALYANRTVDFKIGGDLVKCPELSYKEMKKVNAYEKNESSSPEDEAEMVLWLLNRNTSSKKFSAVDIDNLPAGAVGRIYRECVLLSRQALTDPN